jgi:hypothetical protein
MFSSSTDILSDDDFADGYDQYLNTLSSSDSRFPRKQ